MNRPTLETIENPKKEAPVLIVDLEGSIGKGLAQKISSYAFVVLASRQVILDGENILTVPFKSTFPNIPIAPYSHFVIVISALKQLKNLPQFVKEAKKRGVLLVVISQRDADLVFEIEKIVYPYKEKTAVLVSGDLFVGEGNLPTYLDDLLDDAKTRARVVVPSMGLSRAHPVLLDDFLDATLQIMFGTTIKTGTFLVYPKQSVTVLHLLHTLQKAEPLLKIDFKEGLYLDEEIKGTYIIPNTYEYEQKIKAAFDQKKPSESKRRRGGKKISPHHISKFLIVTALAILVLPLCLSLLFGFVGAAMLFASFRNLEQGSVKSSAALASYSTVFLSVSREFGLPIFQLFQNDNDTFLPQSWIEDASSASTALYSIDDAIEKYQSVFAGKSKNPKTDVGTATDDIRNSIVSYQKIKTQNTILRFMHKDEITPFLNVATGLIDSIPQMINPAGERTYLILFQNNMELRPGGGFIGSYGILKLNRGKVTDFAVHDVYDADGQLRGHVEPPFPIRRYIPVVHWYLRDSNFDIDFSKNAQNAAFFLKEETGQIPDGVLAIDTTFVKDLVGDLGSVYVADYNERVTADNFYLLTQKHAEKDFFPGSTQKKDFLRSLFLAIQQRVEQRGFSYKKMAQTILNDLSQKHVLLAFSDNSVEGLLEANGFSSALSVAKQEGVADFIGISEANLGVNKANYFVRRKIQQSEIVDSEGSISARLNLSYFNGSTGWPGGDYKVYIQVILPQDAKISDIMINGLREKIFPAVTDYAIYEKPGFVPPSGLEVNEYNEDGQSIFGFLTIVPSGKFQTIQIGYSLEQKITDSPSLYSLHVFKQPGTDVYPYEYDLSVSPNFRVVSKNEELQATDSGLRFAQNIVTDKNFSISFAKN